jgi:hypothetical protein
VLFLVARDSYLGLVVTMAARIAVLVAALAVSALFVMRSPVRGRKRP